MQPTVTVGSSRSWPRTQADHGRAVDAGRRHDRVRGPLAGGAERGPRLPGPRRRSAPRRLTDSTGEAPAGGHGGIHPPPRRFCEVEYPAGARSNVAIQTFLRGECLPAVGRSAGGQCERDGPGGEVGLGERARGRRRRAGAARPSVTRASTAGSCTVTVPRLSSRSSRSTMTPSKVSPTRCCSTPASTRSRTAASYRWARRPESRMVSGTTWASPGPSPARRCRHTGPRRSRRRSGHRGGVTARYVGVLRRQGTVDGVGRHLAVEADVPAPAQEAVQAVTIAASLGLPGSRVRMKSG